MKLSVIVCTYNYAHLLRGALRSLAAQSFPYFELLIVDDGSTDGTGEVVRQFRNQFRQCRYLQKPHTGLADSRNFGVRAATGSHIAFLDADDFWSPRYVETVHSVFGADSRVELICGDGFVVQGSGAVMRPAYPPGRRPVYGPLKTARELFDFFDRGSPSATTFCKSLYERVGPYDARFPVEHDWHWLIRAASCGAFCVRLDQKIYLYRRHESNMTVSTPAGKLLEEWLSVYADVLRNSPWAPRFKAVQKA